MSDKYAVVRRIATQLLKEAFAQLSGVQVLPRSLYEPWIHVGREYEGYLIHQLPAFPHFESIVAKAFGPLFIEDRGVARDFPSLYAFPLIAAAVARLTRAEARYDVDHPLVTETVTLFINYLRAGREPTTVIRLVSDLTTNKDIVVHGLMIQPEGSFRRNFESTVEGLIPGMGYEIERGEIISVGRPQAIVVVARNPRVTDGDAIYGAFTTTAQKAELEIDRFLSAARLATGATIRNLVEVHGQPGWFKKYRGTVVPFPHPTMPTVDRTAAIDPKAARNLARLAALIAGAVPVSSDSVPSLALAVQRFNRTFGAPLWTDSVVDLTIALEAAIGEPNATEDVTLRLKSRAAGLLATSEDSAALIFNDLGTFYKLRSAVVHGHPHNTSRVKKLIESIPATSIGLMAMDKVDLAIDRLRDITRRAILARLFLSTGSNPPWPLGTASDLDRRLTDDRERRGLRTQWRRGPARFGFPRGYEMASRPRVLGGQRNGN